MTRWLAAALTVLVLATAGAAAQNRDRKAMAETPDLEKAFNTAVEKDGGAYLEARAAVIERGAAALPFLDARHASPDWRISLTAWILAGWLRNRDLFDTCTEAITGKLAGPIPLTGSFPAKRRIAAASKLGNSVTPRLLEMALKTKELGDEVQAMSIFGSLAALRDLRAVPPLVQTMLTPARRGTIDQSIREWAASTLGELQDPRSVAPLLTVLRDPAAPEMLRAAAAVSLAKLEAREAIPDLRKMAADRSAHLEYRKAAVGAIGELNDAASADGLLRMLPATSDLSFRLYVLGIVGDIGGANVLPELKKVEQQHSDEAVRQAAKEARERIDDRLGVK